MDVIQGGMQHDCQGLHGRKPHNKESQESVVAEEQPVHNDSRPESGVRKYSIGTVGVLAIRPPNLRSPSFQALKKTDFSQHFLI